MSDGNSPFSTPWGMLAYDLRPLLSEGACIKGTPMVPIHKDTLAKIVDLLEEAHREAA